MGANGIEKNENQSSYTLLGADRRPYPSVTPGTLGGYRQTLCSMFTGTIYKMESGTNEGDGLLNF